MQFLRTLFWVVVAIVAVIFSMRNWTTVQVLLWGGLAADVKLPIVLLIAFLAGLLPPFILYRTTRWRLRRRLDQAERALVETRAAAAPAPMPTMMPADPALGLTDSIPPPLPATFP